MLCNYSLIYGCNARAWFSLGSLCAVSDVTVSTKTSEDDVGMMYTLNKQGIVVNLKPTALSNGKSESL